jgi:hypothetical protein
MAAVPVDRDQCRRNLSAVKALRGTRAIPGALLLAPLSVVGKVLDGSGQRDRVVRRNKRVIRADNLAERSGVARENRESARHRLNKRKAELLLPARCRPARENEQISSTVKVSYAIVGHCAGKLDVRRYPEPGRQLPEAGAERTITGDREIHGNASAVEQGYSHDKVLHALCGYETGYGKDSECSLRHAVLTSEPLNVNTHRLYNDPVIRCTCQSGVLGCSLCDSEYHICLRRDVSNSGGNEPVRI